MATEYLLPCECGQNLRITKAQAGQEVSCVCGKILSVPTLRAIGQLEPATSETLEKAGRESGSPNVARNLACAVLMAVMMGGLVFAAYNFYYRVQIDTSYGLEQHLEQSAEYVDTLSPGEVWGLFVSVENLGLGERIPPDYQVQIEVAKRLDASIRNSLIVSGVCLFAFLGVLLVTQPRHPKN